MKIKQVNMLENEVIEGAEAIVSEIQEMIRQVAEKWSRCSCCDEPTEVVELAGSTRGLEVLLTNMVTAVLLCDEVDVDLVTVFGSVEGLKAFQTKFNAETGCLH